MGINFEDLIENLETLSLEELKKLSNTINQFEKDKNNESSKIDQDYCEKEKDELDFSFPKPNNENQEGLRLVSTKHADKKLSKKARVFLKTLGISTIIILIILYLFYMYSILNKTVDKDDDLSSKYFSNSKSISIENTTEFLNSNEKDIIKAFDVTNDSDVEKQADIIASYVNISNDLDNNMNYNKDFIEDVIRIINGVAPKNKEITLDDVIDFTCNWINKVCINSTNYIGGVEEYKNTNPELHLAKLFSEDTIDYEVLKEFDSCVNMATHNKDFKEIYKGSNGILKIFYETLELNGKETKFGLANRNSMSKGGIATLELGIINAIPLLEETDKKQKLEYKENQAVVDKNKNENEIHGYNNEVTDGMNIIKLKLNPLSKDEYENYFSSNFEYVYGISYDNAKKIALTSKDERDFYNNIKNLTNCNVKVEYENQMIGFETFARFFFSYNSGEIQTAEESDLNQDLRDLEETRISNCAKSKTK